MEHWHGFMTARNVVQIYETTIADGESDLSAHVITVPSRSLGGDSYLFRGTDGPFESMGLLRLTDVPLGGVARSLASCLASADVEEFMRRFHEGFEEERGGPGPELSKHFVFASYLTFARVVPFEWSGLSTDSLGNILTAQGHGEAGYMYYEETQTPLLTVAIPAGLLICGPSSTTTRTLEAGLRRRLVEFVKARSGEVTED